MAEGTTSPTSVYIVTRVEQSLAVVAHLSEGIPRYWLLDSVAVEQFVDDATIGIQTGIRHQRADDAAQGPAKLETSGYSRRALVLCAVNCEDVELALGSSKRGRAPVAAV